MELKKIIPGDTAQLSADKIYDNDNNLLNKIDAAVSNTQICLSEARAATKDLEYKLYGRDHAEQEIIPADYKGSYLTGKTTIYYEKQDVLRGKKITAIRANFCKIGSFSIFKAKGVYTTDYKVVETQVLSVNRTGLQIVTLDNPIQLEKDEWFGFYSVEDTAEYYLDDKIADNPVAGGFYHTKDEGAIWHKLHGDTGVGTLIGYIHVGDIDILQDRIATIENIAINELDTIVASTCNYLTDFLTLAPNDDLLKNVAGAIRYSIETLLIYCPDVKIIFVTPPYLGGSSNDKARTLNNRLDNINYLILRTAKWLSCNRIDLTHTCGIAPILETGKHKYLSDYVHPNASGGALIGQTIGNQLINILGSNSIGGAIAFMGDSLTTEDWNNNEWLAPFDKIIQYSKRLNYAQSGATWSHRGATKYNLHNKWGVWNDDNVIWNQINRLIYDIKNNNQIIPDILIIMAGTNDATITI